MNTKKVLVIVVLAFILAVVYFGSNKKTNFPIPIKKTQRSWTIKSIDTMKYSRDLAQEKLNDPGFDQIINMQISKIKETDATHVAIATPYDEKFLPYLIRWVTVARAYNLKIWYRGNFSGWEGWFGEPRNLSREEHLNLVKNFIKNH